MEILTVPALAPEHPKRLTSACLLAIEKGQLYTSRRPSRVFHELLVVVVLLLHSMSWLQLLHRAAFAHLPSLRPLEGRILCCLMSPGASYMSRLQEVHGWDRIPIRGNYEKGQNPIITTTARKLHLMLILICYDMLSMFLLRSDRSLVWSWLQWPFPNCPFQLLSVL